MKVTRELHDTCNAIFKAMKAADPELAAVALARTGAPLTPGTPEHTMQRDLMALSAVASGFATGDRPSKSDLKRVEAILAARLATCA